MKARKHRGGFAESMDTMQEIAQTKEAVAKYFEVKVEDLKITPYTHDAREGWEADTWLVSGKTGVLGMISKEVE